MNTPFVHLHTHSHFSLLNALPSPEALVVRAKEQGATAIALTDLDALYGAIAFYQVCQSEGMKPIIGLDVHVAPEHRSLKRARVDKMAWRLTLLAENNTGYQNLLKLSSLGFLEGFYYTARVDDELLQRYHDGIIALSGDLHGEIAALLQRGDRAKAAKKACFYRDLFGAENFYLELVHRPDDAEQVRTNNVFIELSADTGIPLVATSDSYYLDPEDHEGLETLHCIQKGRTLEEERRMSGEAVDLSLKHPEVMARAFSDVPEAMENTVKIADRCDVTLSLYQNYLPHVDVPEGKTDNEYLREVCEMGLQERYGNMEGEIKERFEYEFGTIANMGFASYFLIVYDFVRFAKEHGILVGPGRGSAAGSIVAYALKITDLDPIKYGLLFERFLNPDRVSMPDIDMDFADTRRAEVLDYVRTKYGSDHVAGIITFGTMMPRAAVRDAARVLGLTFSEADRIAKRIPPPVQGRHMPLARAVKDHAELREDYRDNPLTRQVIDLAMRIEGTPRHASQHACGVVISDRPLTDYVPIQESQHDDLDYVSQYSLSSVEAAGLVKIDFLGLSNLSIIEQALEIIEAVHGTRVNIDTIPLNDQMTFDLLGRGETVGVFQLESEGMQRYLAELKPSEFQDIVAMCALYRPGPLSAGMVPQYIQRKHGRQKVVYDHPLMEEILRETYGVTVYQEQIMKLSQVLAGFTGGEADTLRKAMGKKKRDVLAKMRAQFIAGCQKNGLSKILANKIWADWEGFADYAFNKSHSACYGMIAYRTAYLKAHYPAEFMAAVMNSDSGNIDRMTIEVHECRRIGIDVLPPDVNESFAGFGVVGHEKKIRWGLVAIKNVGEEVAHAMVNERKAHGPYADISDFISRVSSKHVNRKSLESLVKAGAFDRFGERGMFLANIDAILRAHKQVQQDAHTQQGSLFALAPNLSQSHVTLKDAPPVSRIERLGWEKELLGIYITEHPFVSFAEHLNTFLVHLCDVDGKPDGAFVKIGGVVEAVRIIVTKKGEQMAFVRFEDGRGACEAVFFPRAFAEYKNFLTEGSLCVVSGKISEREGQAKSVLANSMVCFTEETFDEVEAMLRQGAWVDEPAHQTAKEQAAEQHKLQGPAVVISLNRAPSEKQISGLRTIFTHRAGDVPVQFSIDAGGRRKWIKTEYAISSKDAVVQAIGEIVGQENVQVVEKG